MEVVALIEEAHDSGARYVKACEVVEISGRTLQRWKREGMEDKRKGSKKKVVRKISAEKREEIIEVCNSSKYCDMSPYEVVPMLLDEGRYICSVRIMYRLLSQEDLIHKKRWLKEKTKKSQASREDSRLPQRGLVLGYHLASCSCQGTIFLRLCNH
jgi:transposase